MIINFFILYIAGVQLTYLSFGQSSKNYLKKQDIKSEKNEKLISLEKNSFFKYNFIIFISIF